ncbi:MAG TPA: molybdopterin-binding protein, partial [Tabrizicola sp.]|nr:molybdopterin-binding protein [Tabrizicola sp.]
VGKTAGLDHSFWKIAMRPGKPLMAGRLNGVPMLGLPGNPVSAIVCGHLFLLPMVRAMLGQPDPAPKSRKARLTLDLPPNGPRAHYMRARLTQTDGIPEITPFDRQDSALLSILGQADALLIRPIDAPACRVRDTVDYLPL